MKRSVEKSTNPILIKERKPLTGSKNKWNFFYRNNIEESYIKPAKHSIDQFQLNKADQYFSRSSISLFDEKCKKMLNRYKTWYVPANSQLSLRKNHFVSTKDVSGISKTSQIVPDRPMDKTRCKNSHETSWEI